MARTDFGNQRDRGPEECYLSEPFELPEGAKVRSLRWRAETPPNTWVKAQLRFAATVEGLADAPWQGPDGSDGSFASESDVSGMRQAGRWIQYRLALGAKDSGSTPRVEEVHVSYGE